MVFLRVSSNMIDGFLVSFIALDGRLSAQLLYTGELLGEKMRRYSRTDRASATVEQQN